MCVHVCSWVHLPNEYWPIRRKKGFASMSVCICTIDYFHTLAPTQPETDTHHLANRILSNEEDERFRFNVSVRQRRRKKVVVAVVLFQREKRPAAHHYPYARTPQHSHAFPTRACWTRMYALTHASRRARRGNRDGEAQSGPETNTQGHRDIETQKRSHIHTHTQRAGGLGAPVEQ